MCGASCGSIVDVMTETATATSHPEPLIRDPADRVVAGVCAAIGRATDTDPVIWRILIGVLTVFAGTGLVLYALGWLLIPKLGEEHSIAERWIRPRSTRWTPGAVALVVIVTVILLGAFDNGRGAGVLAVLAGVGYLVYRERTGRPLAPSYTSPTVPLSSGITAVARVRRPPSRLGAITLSIGTLAAGGLLLAGTYGAAGLSSARVLAVAVLIVGAGLVVGTWWGHARWLAAVGVLLCLAVAVTSVGQGALRGGTGNRTWVVTTDSAFRLGLGDATLDLRGVQAEGTHLRVRASVAVGHLLVLLPPGVPVRVHATARLGGLKGLQDEIGGRRLDRTTSYGPPGDPLVEIDAGVRTGQVEVRRG